MTIISTLFPAGLGALLALLITGTDLSVIAIIAILLLMGIVKKNAIMLIDFALEQERHFGKAPLEAIHAACLERFRPIIMTTLAAFSARFRWRSGFGTGAELRQPLWHRHHRRADRLAGADAVHDAGGLSGIAAAAPAPASGARPPADPDGELNWLSWYSA